MPGKTVHGGRTQLILDNPNDNTSKVVGVFNSCQWSLQYGHEFIHVLGRMSPAESIITSQEGVVITCSGWRTIGHGAHTEMGMPKLEDLLQSEYMSLQVFDRQLDPATGLGTPMTKFVGVRCVGMSTGTALRQAQEMSVTFVALTVEDENTVMAEAVGASELP